VATYSKGVIVKLTPTDVLYYPDGTGAPIPVSDLPDPEGAGGTTQLYTPSGFVHVAGAGFFGSNNHVYWVDSTGAITDTVAIPTSSGFSITSAAPPAGVTSDGWVIAPGSNVQPWAVNRQGVLVDSGIAGGFGSYITVSNGSPYVYVVSENLIEQWNPSTEQLVTFSPVAAVTGSYSDARPVILTDGGLLLEAIGTAISGVRVDRYAVDGTPVFSVVGPSEPTTPSFSDKVFVGVTDTQVFARDLTDGSTISCASLTEINALPFFLRTVDVVGGTKGVVFLEAVSGTPADVYIADFTPGSQVGLVAIGTVDNIRTDVFASSPVNLFALVRRTTGVELIDVAQGTKASLTGGPSSVSASDLFVQDSVFGGGGAEICPPFWQAFLRSREIDLCGTDDPAAPPGT